MFQRSRSLVFAVAPTLLLLVAPSAGAAGTAQDDAVLLESRPVQGAAAKLRFETSVQLTCAPGVATSWCDDHPDLPRQPFVREGSAFEIHQVVQVVDEPLLVEGGHVLELKRSFEQVSTSVSSFGTPPIVSPLQGETVNFRWKGESARLVPEVREERPDTASLVAGLEPDMELRAVLPDGPVEVGARWGIGIDEFLRIVLPGGDLGLSASPGAKVEDRLGDLPQIHVAPLPNYPVDLSLWFGRRAGFVAATYRGQKDVGGLDYHEIQVEFRIRADKDLTGWIQQELGSLSEVLEFDRALAVYGLEGEATVLWDASEACFVSVDLETKLTVSRMLEWNYCWDNPRVERYFFELGEAWSGTLRVTGTRTRK